MKTAPKSSANKSTVNKLTKVATKKGAPARAAKVATKKAASKKAASKKVAAKKVASKKVASKKAPAKKVAPKKVAAKQAAPKKTAPKKAAPKPATGTGSADTKATDRTAPTHTWAETERRAKAPTDADRTLYAVQVAPDVLRREGNKIASDRILTDALRWSGTLVDFVASASPAQVREVRGFSPGLLRVFVAEGARLYEMNERFKSNQKARKDSARVDKVAATSSRKLAQSYRQQLFITLKAAAQQDGDLLRRLAEALGKRELALGIHALTAIARELLADQRSLASQRLIEGGVDADYLTTVDSLADQADATGTRVTGPKKSMPVSQGELDVQDGICLTLMDQLLSAFEAARAINPRIPALIPNATRHYFGGRQSAPKRPTTPAPSPTP